MTKEQKDFRVLLGIFAHIYNAASQNDVEAVKNLTCAAQMYFKNNEIFDTQVTPSLTALCMEEAWSEMTKEQE